jgi:hypothetical protein
MAKEAANSGTATDEKAVVVAQDHGTQIAGYNHRANTGIIQYADASDGVIPDMDDMEVAPLDLASTYWTPETEGEYKNLLFDRFEKSLVPDKYGAGKNDPNATVELETAHFWERTASGEIVATRQASKVLLSILRSSGIERGGMIRIVYRGKKKLANGNTGDTWAVYPLVPKAK